MEIGLKHEIEIIVTENMLANAVGSGLVDVLATPMMIANMEKVSAECVAPYIGEGNVTVGTLVNVTHIAATPKDAAVTFKTELVEIAGKILTFKVEAYDCKDKIGEGTHSRAIVGKEHFEARAMAKNS